MDRKIVTHMETPGHEARTHSLTRDVGRLIWCGAGAAPALGLVLWLINPPSDPLLIASFGGSTIFLFGLTRAPAAQPRSLVGGHLGGALLGSCAFALLETLIGCTCSRLS